jgi:hypothetical protein
MYNALISFSLQICRDRKEKSFPKDASYKHGKKMEM